MLSIRKASLDQFTAECCERFGIDPDAPDAAEQLQAAIDECIASHETMQEHKHLENKDMQRLQDYLDQMIHDIRSIQHSRAWRIGYTLMACAKRLLGRKANGDGFTHIDAVIERYHHWKKARD